MRTLTGTLVLAVCGVGLCLAAAGTVRAARDEIRIATPLGSDPIDLDVGAVVPSANGYLFRMPFSISAGEPIVRVSVDGEVLSLEYGTRVAFNRFVRLTGGENRIRVRAATLKEEAERVFEIYLDAARLPDSAITSRADRDILIFRPAGHRARVIDPIIPLRVPGGETFLIDPAETRPVEGGLMYPFEVEVSAFNPIRSIAIDGRVVSRPDATWSRARAPVLLGPEVTEVRVEAATDWGSAERVFSLRLAVVRLPGSPFYIEHPDAADADQDR